MKRKKRNYIMLMVASIILPFASAYFIATIRDISLYKKTEATIVSVTTKEREGGAYDDRYYYTESDIKCSYTVRNKAYRNTFTVKADYSGMEGEDITIWYNKENPRESVIQSIGITGLIYSSFFTFVSIIVIIIDLINWRNIRIEENKQFSQVSYTDIDIQKFESKKKKQKIINIILIIASILLVVPLLIFLDIPLVVFTIARVMDYKLCYKNISTNMDL